MAWGRLEQGVGRGMPNLPADVRQVEDWLRRWSIVLERRLSVGFGDIHRAIEQFQHDVLGEKFPSGKVQPGDRTADKLKETPRRPLPTHHPIVPPVGALPINPPPGTPLRLPPRTGFEPLSQEDFQAAADTLGCDVRVIQAVGDVEGRGHGFDPHNRPVILFEPVMFRKKAGHGAELAKRHPELTHIRQPPLTPYGPFSLQWRHLQSAYLIDSRAALRSTSWGHFQALGNEYREHGYSSMESMVSALCTSEQTQLTAFVTYMQLKHLEPALQSKDWPAIASGYNGTGYRHWKYDTRIKEAYEKYDY